MFYHPDYYGAFITLSLVTLLVLLVIIVMEKIFGRDPLMRRKKKFVITVEREEIPLETKPHASVSSDV